MPFRGHLYHIHNWSSYVTFKDIEPKKYDRRYVLFFLEIVSVG